MSRKMGRPNSAVVIGRLLKTEGFTDHVSSVVKRYALRKATRRQRERWKRLKKMFGQMCLAKLDDRDRLVMGKFIGTLMKMHFDAALRIGLTCACFPTPGITFEDPDGDATAPPPPSAPSESLP